MQDIFNNSFTLKLRLKFAPKVLLLLNKKLNLKFLHL
jgi:hypothetical protein